jgi:sugar lactone lactonase YvrE
VADNLNSRVNRYDLATGAPSGALGGVLSVATSWIANGTPKTGNSDGMLAGVNSSVTDGTYLYTADSSNHRIVKSNATTGAFIGWIGRILTSPTGGDPGCNGATVGNFTPGWCTGGTAQSGTGNGMLNTPKAIAVDATGTNLYVADTSNHRVSKYTAATGAFVGWVGNVASGACAGAGAMTTAWCAAGTSQSRSGAQIGFNSPAGVTIDSTGTNFYVADTSNNRVWKFDAATGANGGYIGRISTAGGTCTPTGSAPNWCTGGTMSSGTADGQFNAPIGLHVDSTGILFIADSGNNRVQKVTVSTGIAGGWFGRILTSPTGGQAGCNGAGVGTFTPGWCTGGTAQSGTGDGMLNAPSGVVVDPSRAYVYVTDKTNARIMKYAYTTPTFVGWRGNTATATTGGDPGCNTNPVGYFTPGWCTGGTGATGLGNGMMNTPIGVSADSSRIYIGDSGNNRVIRMDQ